MQRMFKIAKQSKIYKKLNQRILTTKPTPDDLKSKKAVFITFSPKKYKSPNFVYPMYYPARFDYIWEGVLKKLPSSI